MKLENLIPCETYEIRYVGTFEYNHYKGKAIYVPDKFTTKYLGAFIVPDEIYPCYFPLEDVFPID